MGFLTVEVEDGIGDLLTRIAEVIRPNLQEGVQEVADVLTGAMQTTAPLGRHFTFGGAPIPGGTLRRSLRFSVGDLGAVLFGVEYGNLVVSGTNPHEIRPRNAPALAFWWERIGQSVVRARVNHPGTAPNDFRTKAIDLAFETGELQRIFEAILGATIAGESMSG